jgi:hypothetical protein
LQTLYHNESDLVVVFLCGDFERKEWPGLEWRAIRDLIKKKQDTAVMFVRLDDADISGVFSIDGYVSAEGRKPSEIAALILRRLEASRANRTNPLTKAPAGGASEFPQSVRDAINQGVDFLNSGHFEKAKVEFL